MEAESYRPGIESLKSPMDHVGTTLIHLNLRLAGTRKGNGIFQHVPLTFEHRVDVKHIVGHYVLHLLPTAVLFHVLKGTAHRWLFEFLMKYIRMSLKPKDDGITGTRKTFSSIPE